MLLPVAAAAALALTGAEPASASSADTEPSSMWVWSAVKPSELVAVASGNGFDRLYVFVSNSPDPAEKSRLRRLANLAGGAGIELWALGGEPRWALHPDEALRWQHNALGIGRFFAGFHVDVEPYALPAWDRNRDRVVRGYLDMLEQLERGPLPLHADVPFWYDTIPSGTDTLADDVLDRVDGVTVMSYRDTATGPNSLWDVGRDMVERGDDAGVTVELAVETNPLADCLHCTFAEEGLAAMQEVVGTVDAIARPHASYVGFAVHDYDGYVALEP